LKRGDIYRVHRPAGDPKQYRIFVVVSRQPLIDSRFSTVICAPVFSRGHGFSTQVPIGLNEGLKHESWIVCDNLVSVSKEDLAQFLGPLAPSKLGDLDRALGIALGLA
jgi:mRNA interferase MazF